MSRTNGLLILVWVIACAAFIIGVIVGRAIQRWARPDGDNYDAGWRDALDTLGWLNGYPPQGGVQ